MVFFFLPRDTTTTGSVSACYFIKSVLDFLHGQGIQLKLLNHILDLMVEIKSNALAVIMNVNAEKLFNRTIVSDF